MAWFQDNIPVAVSSYCLVLANVVTLISDSRRTHGVVRVAGNKAGSKSLPRKLMVLYRKQI
jgi:hypothetical protein